MPKTDNVGDFTKNKHSDQTTMTDMAYITIPSKPHPTGYNQLCHHHSKNKSQNPT